MAAATESFSDTSYVGFAFATNAEAKLISVGYFAKKDGRFDTSDTDEVVDDSLAIFSDGADAVHILAGDPGPGEIVVTLEV